MKKIKVILIIISILFIVGCKKVENENIEILYKEKIIDSINYLEDFNFYEIETLFDYGNPSNDNMNIKTVSSVKFDEINKIIERTIMNTEEILSNEYIKFDYENNSIIRYYATYSTNKYGNRYQNKYKKYNYEMNEENNYKYTLNDKSFYIDMINNAIKYNRTEDGYYQITVSKDYIQKIYDELSDIEYKIDDEVVMTLILDDRNLSTLQFTLKEKNRYEHCYIHISFTTEFHESIGNELELPNY